MKAPLEEMLNELSVPRLLQPYEDHLWTFYAPEEGVTCMAEVRLSGEGRELEAEMQVMYDTPPEGGLPVKQIMILQAKQDVPGQFTVKTCSVMGDDMVENGYNWGGRSCKFWRACVEHFEREELPDFEYLKETEMEDDGMYGDQMGDGGGRNPKIRTGQLLGMKKSGGF